MLLVNVIGGLGNQMFQYAYACSLSNRGYDVKLSIADYASYTLHDGFVLDKYNISLEIATPEQTQKFKPSKLSKKLSFLPFFNILQEKTLLFDMNNLSPKDGCFVEGYFQCEKYFVEYRDLILHDFVFNHPFAEYTQRIEESIKETLTSISLHIRRGDYINNDTTNSIHGTCSLDYYREAISYFEKKYQGVVFFIFSDDIEWVKSNFNLDNFVYVESTDNRLPHEDMYLMTLCDHNITANSSFSWWGAWLNTNQEKEVIAPKYWFKDVKKNLEAKNIVPDNWIRL